MISVIISSAKKELLAQVSKNISDTIAVKFEIIAFDNSNSEKGICEIYNQGIKKAQYDILCFMHEDIAMITQGWGEIVANIFTKNPDIGLIGVAGNSYKPLTPTGGIGNDNYYRNLIQGYKYSDKESVREYLNPQNKSLVPVVTLDGVWLCTTRQLAQKHLFDESFTGFHAYDMDFSLSVGREKTVAVTYDVLLEHFSEGNYSEVWLKDIIKLYEKWYHVLPLQTESFTKKQKVDIERKTFKHFIKQIRQSNLSMRVANHFLWKNNSTIKLDALLFFKLQFYVLIAWAKQLSGIKPK